jgi:hypothetical protein
VLPSLPVLIRSYKINGYSAALISSCA